MKEFRHHCRLMGSAFEFIVIAADEQEADIFFKAGKEEVFRIEKLLTEFSPDSETARINAMEAHKIYTINAEVYSLLERCKKLSEISQGAFDITIGPLKKLYRFQCEEGVFPKEEELKATLSRTGFQHILLLGNNRIFLEKRGMKISFAAIGKGYAADRVRKIWKEMELTGGVINASGDLSVMGTRADGSNWQTGIADPGKETLLMKVNMPTFSVATSGDYEQFFTHKGEKYSHTLHPKTGLPLKGIRSVSVFSPSAELSDALATAVYVMGLEAGKHFIQQLPGTYCVIAHENKQVYSNLPS